MSSVVDVQEWGAAPLGPGHSALSQRVKSRDRKDVRASRNAGDQAETRPRPTASGSIQRRLAFTRTQKPPSGRSPAAVRMV